MQNFSTTTTTTTGLSSSSLLLLAMQLVALAATRGEQFLKPDSERGEAEDEISAVRREYVFPLKDAKNATHFPKNRIPLKLALHFQQKLISQTAAILKFRFAIDMRK